MKLSTGTPKLSGYNNYYSNSSSRLAAAAGAQRVRVYRDISKIEHVYEYPTMYDLGNPRHTQSMIAYMILSEYFWKFQ